MHKTKESQYKLRQIQTADIKPNPKYRNDLPAELTGVRSGKLAEYNG